MIRRAINYVFLVSGILFSVVSSKSSALTTTDVKPLPVLQSSFNKDFVGTIDKYPVCMHLERNNSDLHGRYYYVPQKVVFLSVADELFLAGKVDGKGEFTLEETSYSVENKMVQTGRFHGTITQTGRAIKLNGIWTRPHSDKPLKLELIEVGSGLPRGLEVKTARMGEPNRKLADKVEALYPRIDGSSDKRIMQCNRFIKNHVAKRLDEFKKEVLGNYNYPDVLSRVSLHISYEVKFAAKDMISLVLLEETDYAGAHPNHYQSFVNYSIKRGREIKLPQIFKRNVDYKAVLNRLCRNFDNPGISIIAYDFEAGNLSDWYFDNQGIYIHFEVPFAVGGNAAVFIPYKELKNVLAPDWQVGKAEGHR